MIFLSLFSVLCLCTVSDLKTRRIPNKYIAAGIIHAAVLCSVNYGIPTGINIFLVRVTVILSLLMPFYVFKKLGGGDIKLICVIAAYISIKPALISFAAGVYLCLIPIIFHYIKYRSFKGIKLPMAPSILAGTMICYLMQR